MPLTNGSKRMTYLEEYRNEIRKGNIIAGQELITALDTYIADIHSEEYAYDTKAAYIRMDFMETFIKLTKSPFYGQPIKLMQWQKAFIECFYSMKRSDGTDRFKKALLLIARKNTKSETCNALGLSELMLGHNGADIVCSSNDDSQANILYDGIDTMRLMFDPKSKRTHKNLREIKNKKNGSKVFKLSDKTKNKEGRNIDFAIIDEVHEMKDKVIINAIEQSQSLKENPKEIIITTEGYVSGGALDSELAYARKVLAGEIDDDTLMVWLYTQDSEQEIWQDESTWQKSNPTLGIVKKYDYLRERIKRSRIDSETRISTLCKDFNIKQNTAQAWLLDEQYKYPQEIKSLEDFRNCYCLAACDLSETTDLTNVKILFMRPGDKTKYIFSHYFIPESKLQQADDKSAGAKYEEWCRRGCITICDGNDNDLTQVADWLYNLKRDYSIRVIKCGYDVKFSKVFINRMEEYGIETELIQQSKEVMSPAMKLLEADLKAHLVNYGNNPVDAWCFGNASCQLDKKGRIFCVKSTVPARIDGAVTAIILYATLQRFRTEFNNYIS